jgi:hypothetical protein
VSDEQNKNSSQSQNPSGPKRLTAEEIKRLEIEEMLAQTDSQSASKESDESLDKLREKLDLLEYRRHNPHPNKFIGFLKPYKVTFPKEYYRHMHRLLGLSTTDEALRTHPSVVAQNTNDIVYRRFHRYNGSTLKDLQLQNPRCVGGYRLHKHFQFLSDDAETMLDGFLSDAIEAMNLYGDWDTFHSAYCIKHKLPYQLRILY